MADSGALCNREVFNRDFLYVRMINVEAGSLAGASL
jgi:hypothetical protein